MNSHARGFTLIELIIVIVVLGAMVALASVFIVSPFRVSGDVTRRAELVDIGQTALNRVTREVRQALPNSIRVDASGRIVEFLLTRSGGRYRREVGAPGDPVLNINANAGTFDVLGNLPNAGSINTGAAGGDCGDGNADCLVVFNTGDTAVPVSLSTNAYDRSNVAPITAVGASTLSYGPLAAPSSPGFPAHSPNQRFFVVEGPVSFRCDLVAGTLTRHQNYGITTPQPTTTAALGAGALLADDLSDCDFDYRSGAGSRHGLLTVRLDITQSGETVSLLQQVHILNVP